MNYCPECGELVEFVNDSYVTDDEASGFCVFLTCPECGTVLWIDIPLKDLARVYPED